MAKSLSGFRLFSNTNGSNDTNNKVDSTNSPPDRTSYHGDNQPIRRTLTLINKRNKLFALSTKSLFTGAKVTFLKDINKLFA